MSVQPEDPNAAKASPEPARVRRERKTIAAMVRIYCRKKHGKQEGRRLCEECDELLRYAFFRLDRCPYGDEKPTCVKCPIHCYRPDMRERTREVMRFAGPKMIFSHAILALRHVLDGLGECEGAIKKPDIQKPGARSKLPSGSEPRETDSPR